MNIIASAGTDIGNIKKSNQDSLNLKLIKSKKMGSLAFGVICDGVGGFQSGEIASATIVNAFDKWVRNELQALCETEINADIIKESWMSLLHKYNKKLVLYGEKNNLKLATTVTAILILENAYFIINIGDTRAYLINKNIKQLTIDHTFIARELQENRITEYEAMNHPKKNVITQCVGASNSLKPDFYTGDIQRESVFMLCSDGFRNKVSSKELFYNLNPAVLNSYDTVKSKIESLISLNKKRNETDNISAIVIRIG